MPETVAKLNPAALSIADAARLLSRAGGRAITEQMVRVDVQAGAPANPDGTINLVHYTAWLIRDMAAGGGDEGRGGADGD